MSKHILIGKITGTHGIKGLVKIFPMCEDVRLLNGILMTDQETMPTITVKTKNPQGKFILAEVDGITDRTAAEKLKCSLFVSRETLPETEPEDGYYITDLIGLDVYEQNQKIGTVLSVDNFGASDLIEIQPLAGKSFYIPFVDDYVLELNIKENRITVDNIDDFREF